MLISLGLALLSTNVSAISGMQLSLGSIHGQGWALHEAVLWLNLGEGGSYLQAKRIQLPPPHAPLEGVRLSCPQAALESHRFRCPKGRLDARWDGRALRDLPVRLSYDWRSGRGEVDIRGLPLVGGRVDARLKLNQGRWQAELSGVDLQADQALVLAGAYADVPEGMQLGGAVALSASAAGQTGAERLNLSLNWQAAEFSDATGLRAGEGLRGTLDLQARRQSSEWLLEAGLVWQAGAGYVDPLYIEVDKEPLRMDARLRYHPQGQSLRVESFEFRHPELFQLNGDLDLSLAEPARLDRLNVAVKQADLARVFPVYAQPFLLDSSLDELELEGRANARLRWRGGKISGLDLNLDGVYLDDPAGRFGLYGLDGRVAWSMAGVAAPSSLSWQGGHLYKLDLGASTLHAQASRDGFVLTDTLSIPVLGGGVDINRLSLQGLAGGKLSWELDGGLRPVPMDGLARAFGWPEFSGELAGIIPAVRYRDGQVSIDGALMVSAFDGQIIIYQLSLRDPLGLAPELSAQVDLNHLDLEALTSAFSFGRIQGRLEGWVHDLHMQDWQPVSFDARLQTPEDDDSRHRISQRAVDNLASVGGVGGALSSTFLSFFEEFSYDRLGLGCRLSKGICAMSGVASGEQGYYIVRGGGIPRIDVMGYNSEVDWNSLLERLKAVTAAEGPVVE